MTDDTNVYIDEKRRQALHGAVKDEVRKELRSEIGTQAVTLTTDERNRATAVADQLKEKALNELTKQESAIELGRGAARISQVVDYIFFLIYGFIGLEIVLQIIGARDSNAFKRFIDAVCTPFLVPFRAIVPSLTIGRFELNFSDIVAFIVYLMLRPAINGLLKTIAFRQTKI